MRLHSYILIAFGIAAVSGATGGKTAEAASAATDEAGAVRWKGRVFTDVYAPTTDIDDPFRQASVSGWLTAEPRIGEHSSGIITLQADAFAAQSDEWALGGLDSTALGNPTRARLTLREGFASYSRGDWELRAGKQILNWGRPESGWMPQAYPWFSPVDWWGAKDLAFFNPDEETKRLGSIALSGHWSPHLGTSPFVVSAFLVPVAPESRVLLNPALRPSVAVSAPESVWTLERAELGARVYYASSGWDLALVAFRGLNHLPELEVVGAQLFPRYRSQSAIGLDLSFQPGLFSIRAESGYVFTENPLLGKPSHWDSQLTLEHPLGEWLRVVAQGRVRVIPSRTAVIPASQLETEALRANQAIQDFARDISPTLGLGVRFASTDWGLDAEVFGNWNPVLSDYALRPRVAYAWSESVRSVIGADWFGGPIDTPIGQWAAFSSAFFETRLLF